MCISKPDHRPSRNESLMTQTRINQIPKAPRRQGLADSVKRDWLNQVDIDTMRRLPILAGMRSRAWSRIHPHGLIPTVTTAVSPACRFTGRWLHWDQDRLVTIMEVRRAQGYPDEEVLVGRPANQWKIVGNSVARQVALALGVSLREACLVNEKRRRQSKGQSITADIEEAAIQSELKDEDEEKKSSTPAHYDAINEAVDILSFFQQDSGTSNPDVTEPIRKHNFAVEISISSRDDSSKSTKSTTRTTATSTEPSSRDESDGGSSSPSRKRGLNVYQPFVISDSDDSNDNDEESVSPVRKKIKVVVGGGGGRSSPIVLD